MIHEVGNVVLCELTARYGTQSTVQTMSIILGRRHRLLHVRGTSRATERRRTRNLSSTPWIFFRFRITTSRKGDPTGTDRHEKKPGDYQYFVANSLKKKCKKKNFLGIHDRIIRDEKFRNVGRSEELCRVHTHHITAEEISVYRNNWWLRQLVPIRSMPVRRRADLKQALSTLRLLKHQENTAH